jgi:hypothetical protein
MGSSPEDADESDIKGEPAAPVGCGVKLEDVAGPPMKKRKAAIQKLPRGLVADRVTELPATAHTPPARVNVTASDCTRGAKVLTRPMKADSPGISRTALPYRRALQL